MTYRMNQAWNTKRHQRAVVDINLRIFKRGWWRRTEFSPITLFEPTTNKVSVNKLKYCQKIHPYLDIDIWFIHLVSCLDSVLFSSFLRCHENESNWIDKYAQPLFQPSSCIPNSRITFEQYLTRKIRNRRPAAHWPATQAFLPLASKRHEQDHFTWERRENFSSGTRSILKIWLLM
jgi:hypothetical protein